MSKNQDQVSKNEQYAGVRHDVSHRLDKSLRRRLIACLRLAHRCLGMKRDRLGLGIDASGQVNAGRDGSAASFTLSVLVSPLLALCVALPAHAQYVAGGGTSAGGPGAIAIGGNGGTTSANGANGTAVGNSAQASGTSSTALGSGASSSGASATALVPAIAGRRVVIQALDARHPQRDPDCPHV